MIEVVAARTLAFEPKEATSMMIKLVYVIRKRDDVPAEKFHKYWLENHGPLVRSFANTLKAKK